MKNRRGHVRIVMAGAVVLSAFAGCEKKKPPPPPPPPPPPAVETPKPVDVNGIMQVMHPDARVQFPEQFAPLRQEIAEAVIAFADAFARADAEALRGMLDESGRQVLSTLLATGRWDEAAERIEAVRVVHLRETSGGDEAAAAPDPGQTIQNAQRLITAEYLRDELIKKIRENPGALQSPWSLTGGMAGDPSGQPMMDEAQARAIAEMMLGRELVQELETFNQRIVADPSSAEAVVNEMYETGTLGRLAEATKKMMEGMQGELESMASEMANFGEAFGFNTGPTVTYAIQEPGGAYLLRFGLIDAGGEFIFKPLATEKATQARASDFDGVSGEVSFALSSLNSDSVLPAVQTPEVAPGEVPGDPSGPTRKNTPGGPVTIPTAPGG